MNLDHCQMSSLDFSVVPESFVEKSFQLLLFECPPGIFVDGVAVILCGFSSFHNNPLSGVTRNNSNVSQ